jgi:iron complex outermembrane receptor protein
MWFTNSIPGCPGKWLPRSLADASRRLLLGSFRLTRIRSLQHVALCELSVAFLITVIVTSGVMAQKDGSHPPGDLTNLSLDQLMNVEVTSVSKHEQKLFEAPAAIYVISQEDIRRSGITSIPDLLRMVPGLQVARITSSKWAITSRGSNSEFSNKLLVLIDGRSVYTPLFAGVFWDVQDLMLEDIERIEVIRGPGATMWGANAVNGVINIITKKARNTQGGLVIAGGGSEERGFGGMRYGGKIGADAYYRVYAKFFDRNHSLEADGSSAPDGWDALRGGFRLDWNASNRDSITVQGDIYHTNVGQKLRQTVPVPPFTDSSDEQVRASGGNILTRWTRELSGESSLSLQFYYDRTQRNEAALSENRDTFDFDFQHRLVAGRNEIVWGMGARASRDDVVSSFTVSLNPSSRTTQMFNVFAQDEITLVKNRLRLTIGSKFEHNFYTGIEIEPSLRMMWTPNKSHALWAAFSHADRTPSRVEEDFRVNVAVFPGQNGLLNYVSLFGSRRFKAEEVHAYELGYNFRPSQTLSFQFATFYNFYDELSLTTVGTPFLENSPQPAHLVIPLQLGNGGKSETTGIEAAARWVPAKQWQLAAGYTWFERKSLGASSGSALALQFNPSDNPRNQFHVRSVINLHKNLECDAALYYVDKLSSIAVPRYLRTDVRFGWRPNDAIELSFSGQNLFDKSHLEFGASALLVGDRPIAVARSLVGKLTWRF